MKLIISTVAGVLLVTCALPISRAAFIVEADNVPPAGKAFDHFVSTPPGSGFSLSATPSTALGLIGNQSAFGNPANATGPDLYTFNYTPGVDADNTVFAPDTVLGNSSGTDLDGAGALEPLYVNEPQLATGKMGGQSGYYNVYFTVPPSANVEPAGSLITVGNSGSPVELNPVRMNNGDTGPDSPPGGAFTGGANSMWLKIATVPLIAGNNYTVTILANNPSFVSQRAHGVMWEFVQPLVAPPTPPGEQITNGDFEAGLIGWTVDTLPGGSGDWFIDTPGTTTPISAMSTTPNPNGGNFYAVTDQGGPGTNVLRQSFTVPAGAVSVKVSFEMFVNDSDGGPIVHPAGLDHNAIPNQHSRVDILTANAATFSTNPSDIVANLYLGVDPQVNNPNPYTSYEFDITGLVVPGETYQLRFAEVDNQFFLNHGVDNVSIFIVVPEPPAMLLLAAAMGSFALTRRRTSVGSPAISRYELLEEAN